MTVADFMMLSKNRLSGLYEDQREVDSVIQIVMEEFLGVSRYQLKFKMLDNLDVKQEHELVSILQRLETHEPVQYVLGTADFYGLTLSVNRNVLIPRPETEELVGVALKTLKSLKFSSKPRLLDIGTGSGCIAIALKKNLDCELVALDVSREAIEVAKSNAKAHQCDINFITNDFLNVSIWEELGRFDAVISNPPYVTEEELLEMMPRVKDYEPRVALTAASLGDPLVFYRKIAHFAETNLNDQGLLFLELNAARAGEIVSFFNSRYFTWSLIKDLQGANRMLLVKKQ